MGHIRDRWKDPRRTGVGKRWQVKYQVDGKERDGGSFDNKSVAKRRLTELEAGLHQGRWIDPNNPVTVTEQMRGHARTRMHNPRTARRVESLISTHVEGTPLGARRIVTVRPSEAQAWVSDRATVLASSTLRLLVTQVKGAFSAAVHDNLIPANPFQRVTLPRVERERVIPLTVSEVAQLAATVPDRYRAMIVAQSGLGLRIGELLALRVENVDFLRRMVRVEHQVDSMTLQLVAPKTSRSRRSVPLPEVVSLALSEHIRKYPPAPDGLIFHTRDGLPIRHDTYGNKVLVPAARKAGLPEGTTSHALRHHYASVLLAAGESVVAVAERLGHDDASLVLSTYGHLMPDMEDHTRRAIDAAWSTVTAERDESTTAQGRPR